MKWVKSIRIDTENCEEFKFDYNVIGDFHIDKIQKSIDRAGTNCIGKFYYAEEVYIEIFKEGNNKNYKPFEEKDCKGTDLFKRIEFFNDITHIGIEYEDGTVETIGVDYVEQDPEMLGSPNINQKTKISDLGNIYIAIDKNYTEDTARKRFYDYDVMNDEKIINSKKRLYTTEFGKGDKK